MEVDRESGITADMKGKTQGIDREKDYPGIRDKSDKNEEKV